MPPRLGLEKRHWKGPAMAKCEGGLPSSTLALSMSCSPHERAEQWIEKEALVRLSKHKGRKDRDRERGQGGGGRRDRDHSWLFEFSFLNALPFDPGGKKGGTLRARFVRRNKQQLLKGPSAHAFANSAVMNMKSDSCGEIFLAKPTLAKPLLRGVLSGVLDSKRERERGSCKRKFRFGRMSCFMKIRGVA